MSGPIFGKEAPRYWARGLSVTPLKGKNAFLSDWNKYHDCLPSPDTQNSQLAQYSNYNVGLITGKQSGITLIDVDTEDPILLEAIKKILPPSPWVRIGRKGFAIAYKWADEKSSRIKDKDHKTILEIFSSRLQMVLPPSIHPDTMLPYTSNSDLLDVLDKLEYLPDNFEDRMRFELGKHVELAKPGEGKGGKDFKALSFTSQGGRDTRMTQYAGILAYDVIKGDCDLKTAMEMMQAWGDNFVEKVAGDPLDITKGISHIVQFILRDVHQKNRTLPPGWDNGLTAEQKLQWGMDFTAEQEQWTSDAIMVYLDGQFRSHEGANNPKRLEAIEFVLKKIHQSTALTTLETDRILSFIAKQSGSAVPVGSYKRRLVELDAGTIAGVNHTEIAEAAVEEFKHRRLTDIRWHNEGFWEYQGSHWIEVNDLIIQKIIAQEFGHMEAAKRYSDITGIKKTMMSLVETGIQRLPVDGVNFANGFLTTDLQLLAHNPDFGMTYEMPFNYDPSKANSARQFSEFLFSVWGHSPDYLEKVEALREAIAATIFGIGTKFQRCVCLFGAGGSGKSQILDIVSRMVPDKARSAVSPDEWGETFVPSMLQHKLLNICGELHEDRQLSGKHFKEIVDGSEITAQFKRKDLFQFRASATHWFSGNSLPRSRDISHGFNRRWLFLKFDKVVKTADKVLDLGKKIADTEMEAIVAWALAVTPRLLSQKDYSLPPSHLELQEKMALQNSSVRQFMKEKIYFKENAKIITESLYMVYWGHIIGKSRGRPVPEQRFMLDLEQFLAETPGFVAIMEGDKAGYLHMGVRP